MVPRSPLLRTACLLAAGLLLAGAPGRPAEAIRTFGRRLACTGDTLVLTEPDLNRIVLYDVSGPLPRKRLAFGAPGARPGQLSAPHGALLEGGEILVADTFNHRIQVFRTPDLPTARPRLVRAWGEFGSAIGELKGPQAGFAVASQGRFEGVVFVPDTRNHRVQAFRTTGEPAGVVLGGQGSAEGRLDTPVAAAFDPSGTILYVAESGSRRISAFDPEAARLLFTFMGEPNAPLAPAGLAVDESGTVYLADVGRRQVRVYRPMTSVEGRIQGLKAEGAWGRQGTGPGEWSYPQSIAVDGKGRVYVCDLADDRCQVFSTEGRYLGAFGEDVTETPLPEPPVGNGRFPVSVCSNGGTYRIEFLGAPFPAPSNQLFGFQFGVAEGCTQPRALPDVAVTVNAVMPLHRHGMNTQPRVHPRGDGRYVAEGLRLHTSGHWELHVDVTRRGVTERTQVDLWVD